MLIFSQLRIPTIKQALTGTLLLLALALFMMPQAMACHKGKPHGKDTDCGGGGSSSAGPSPIAIDTILELAGPQVRGDNDESGGWTCTAGGPFTYEIGNYTCAAAIRPIFLSSKNSSTLIYPKKYRAICTALGDGITLIPDTGGLSYGWTDGCKSDDGTEDRTCAVEVKAIFSDDPVGVNGQSISDLSGGKANVLDVVMHGQVDTSSDDPLNFESNPFHNPREIHITSVVFEFMKAGSTRSVATCTMNTPQPQNYLLSSPITLDP